MEYFKLSSSTLKRLKGLKIKMRHTINAEARQKEMSAARKGSSVWGHTMDASQQLHDELSLSG